MSSPKITELTGIIVLTYVTAFTKRYFLLFLFIILKIQSMILFLFEIYDHLLLQLFIIRKPFVLPFSFGVANYLNCLTRAFLIIVP